METKNRKLVDQLEEILEKNRDAQKGYAKAAENADNSNLKAYFNTKSRERSSFNDSLKRELVTSYDEIDDDGSFVTLTTNMEFLNSADNDVVDTHNYNLWGAFQMLN